MSSKEIKVGGSIQSKCTKCKEATRHIIVAIADDKPVKVQCAVCEGQHLYRSPDSDVAVSKVKKAARPRKKATSAASARQSQQWSEQMAGRNESSAAPYAMAGAFKKNSIIRHSKFGLGVVERLVDPNKMEVLFEVGTKTLVRGQ